MKLVTLLVAMVACTLPAAAQYDETAKSFHLLPHLADGGGWQSVLLVTNVSQSESRCTFNVYGIPLNRFRDFDLTGSTATFQLEGFGGYLIWGTKNELAAVASGYATLDCSVPVVAQVVFASYDGLGVTAAATVFSAQAATVFQFPVLQPPRRLAPISISFDSRLGFAIANDTNAEASCRIVLEDYQRTNLGEATLSVPAKSNRAQMLHDAIAIPGTFFGGTATVSCNQPVAMIGLHFELRDGKTITFSTLPPAILSTTPVSPPSPVDTGDPWSRPNIERFRGTWQFTYTKDRAAITDTFVLSIIIEQADEPGEWAIGGLQDDGTIAVLFYSRDSDSYVLGPDALGEIDELYSFNLTSPTTVSGCYYEIFSSTSLSSCYPMTGVKTSSAALSGLTSALLSTTAGQAESAEIREALERLREVGVRLEGSVR